MNQINFKTCTFTGVDKDTSLTKLEDLSSLYSFLEWGILYSTSSENSEGRNRYPNKEWFEKNINNLFKIKQKTNVSLALHVCGAETKNLINQKPSFLLDILHFFDRVQINFRYKETDLILIDELLKKYSNINFITQQNKANFDLYTKITQNNHQVLFDLSGGRGIETEDWLAPLENKICGYAGGLGPNNINRQFDNILKQVNNLPFWIDMEGQIRTDDKLDLDKCQQVSVCIQEKIKQKYQIKF